MVKGDKSRFPTGLPREVLSRLNPNLAELHSQLPSVLAARISVLVREALPLRIHPNRLLRFAYLYANAERLRQRDARSREHTRRSKLELAGNIHGLETGYRDELHAKQTYRRGRRARQQIKASLDAFL